MRVTSIKNNPTVGNYKMNFKGESQNALNNSVVVFDRKDYKIAKRIWRKIAESNDIVIVTHKFSDGDAIGAGLTLLDTIQRKFPGKKIQFCVPKGYPSFIKGMPNIDKVTTKKPEGHIGLTILVDTDETYADGLGTNESAAITIDHHRRETPPKGILLINSDAPSTTAVLYNKLFRPLGIKISPDAAECTLVGMYTDTGGFRRISAEGHAIETRDELLALYSNGGQLSIGSIEKKFERNKNTSSSLHRLTERLKIGTPIIKTESGIEIRFKVLSQKKLQKLKVKDSYPDIHSTIGLASNFMRDSKKISITTSHGKRKRLKVISNRPAIQDKAKNTSGLPIKSKRIGIIFWELGNNEIKVTMRSNGPDLREYVYKYNGGGHATAAGFTIKGNVVDVVAKILSEVKKYPFK